MFLFLFLVLNTYNMYICLYVYACVYIKLLLIANKQIKCLIFKKFCFVFVFAFFQFVFFFSFTYFILYFYKICCSCFPLFYIYIYLFSSFFSLWFKLAQNCSSWYTRFFFCLLPLLIFSLALARSLSNYLYLSLTCLGHYLFKNVIYNSCPASTVGHLLIIFIICVSLLYFVLLRCFCLFLFVFCVISELTNCLK